MPEGWQWKKLGEVVENHDGKRQPVKSKDREGIQGEFPYYGASGIIDYVNEYLFDGEYLLISEDGANLVARNTPIAFGVKGKFWVNNHAHVITAKPEIVTNQFLEFFLAVYDISTFITGSAQPKLSQKKMNDIPILLPPLPTQQKIVAKIQAAFARLDEAIERQKQNIQRVENLKKAVLEEVFEGLNKNSKGIQIREICTAFNGYAFDSNIFNEAKNGYQVVRIGNVLDLNKNPVYVVPSNKYDKWRLQKGDVIMSLTGTRRKQDYLFATIIEHENMYLNQRVACFRMAEGYENKYLYYFFGSEVFRGRIFESETGAVNQGNMSLNPILDFYIPNINSFSQQKIVAHLDRTFAQADELLAAQKARLARLEALKKSILEEAFRGELCP